jgi:hypothetical protein
MATYNYKPGLGNVGSYQASGIPYVTCSLTVPANNAAGGALNVQFPSVTREFTVRNDGSQDIRVGFSAAGVSGSATNFFSLAATGSFSAPMKVTDLFLISSDTSAGEATVIGVLTGIDRHQINNNWSGSAGVG